MARFFEVKFEGSVCYIDRERINAITVDPAPDSDGDYLALYDVNGGTVASCHKTLEEAKAEALKIAEGRVSDEITEENACSPVNKFLGESNESES